MTRLFLMAKILQKELNCQKVKKCHHNTYFSQLKPDFYILFNQKVTSLYNELILSLYKIYTI